MHCTICNKYKRRDIGFDIKLCMYSNSSFIFANYAYILIAKARTICKLNNEFEVNIEGNVYAIDSTTIDLCLNVFWWAKFIKKVMWSKIVGFYSKILDEI